MTKEVAAVEGKYVSGYYNGNRWPVQIVISRFNVTLHLRAGEFILDTNGRKINDPFFELYAKQGQLARELSDVPVAPITVPVIKTAVTPAVSDGQSVRSVTEFSTDAKGVKHPIIPKPMIIADQPVNKPSYIGMSMEEARKAGLIRKVREVPEDYGVPDNNSSSPPRTPPPIKYAMDTDQPARPHAELPKQLEAALPKAAAQERRQIQASLIQGEKTAALLDSETGFMDAVKNNPADIGITTGMPKEAPAATDIIEELPAPEVPDVLATASLEEETPIPAPQVKPIVPPPGKKNFVCLECERSFKLRPELVGHAKREHPEKVNSILAAYPA